MNNKSILVIKSVNLSTINFVSALHDEIDRSLKKELKSIIHALAQFHYVC